MKHLLSLAAAVCATISIAAPQVTTLRNGDNFVNTPGEIVGIECMTVGASQSVAALVVTAVSEYTNAYKSVTTPHTRYDFTITNYDGRAAISTNILDNFKYADWRRGTTNLIVGAVKPSRTNITEQVADGKRLKATYTKETAIGSGSASSHYLKLTPASTLYFFGGNIRVQCGDGDNITLLIK